MPIKLVNKKEAQTLMCILDAIQEEAKRIGVSVSVDKGNVVALDWKQEVKNLYTVKYHNICLRIELRNNGQNFQGSIESYMKVVELSVLSPSFAEAERTLMAFVDELKNNVNDDEEEYEP
jgi:hypothetical protein